MNKNLYINGNIKIVILIAILILSCNRRKFSLVSTVRISEDSAVIHHLPIVFSVIDDSTISFKVSPVSYCLYNIKTGKVVRKITIADSVLKRVVAIAKNAEHLDYQQINKSDERELGIPAYEIDNMYIDSKTDTLFVFLTCRVKLEDPDRNKPEKDRQTQYVALGSIATMVSKDNKIGSICYIHSSDSIDANALTGVRRYNHHFFMKNTGDSASKIIAVLGKSSDSIYSGCGTKIPYDPISESMVKNHKMQYITFSNRSDADLTICNGFSFFDGNGKDIYRYKDSISDQIYAFIRNKSKLLFHTLKKEDNRVFSSVYGYDLSTHNLEVFDRFEGVRIGNFIDNHQFVCIVKEGDYYYFKTYQLYG